MELWCSVDVEMKQENLVSTCWHQWLFVDSLRKGRRDWLHTSSNSYSQLMCNSLFFSCVQQHNVLHLSNLLLKWPHKQQLIIFLDCKEPIKETRKDLNPPKFWVIGLSWVSRLLSDGQLAYLWGVLFDEGSYAWNIIFILYLVIGLERGGGTLTLINSFDSKFFYYWKSLSSFRNLIKSWSGTRSFYGETTGFWTTMAWTQNTTSLMMAWD